jgi:hypothetical protein
MTGFDAVPTTRSPVTRRPVRSGRGVPSSSWFAMFATRSIVSVAVTV